MKTTLIAKIEIEIEMEWAARCATLEEAVNESIQRNLNAELFGGDMGVTAVTVTKQSAIEADPSGIGRAFSV